MKFMISILVLLALLTVPCIADQRSGSAGVPYIPPDASLKTTDPFYQGIMARQYGTPDPANDPWAGVPEAHNKTASNWMNLGEHNEKLQNSIHYSVPDAYGLTETQLTRAGIAPGQESWL